MPDDRRPDAVLVPVALAMGGDFTAKLNRLRAICGPILQLGPDEAIDVPAIQGDPHFYVRRRRAHPHEDPQFYPPAHERAGQPRHDWEERHDGVKVGRLRPEDPAP